MSKFKEIANDVKSKIISGEFAINSLLPSESKLMEQYDSSRQTVRKSLQLLSEAGFIQTQRGKGSYVLDRNHLDFPFSELTSYQEVIKQNNRENKTVTIELEKIKVPSEVQKAAKWSPETMVWKFIRQREIDNVKAILDIDYVLADLVPDLTLKITNHSTYQYFEQDLNLDIAFAMKDIGVEQATKLDRKYLDLNNSNEVVVIKNLVYLADNTLFQYTESRHLLNKFHFTDFARRKKA